MQDFSQLYKVVIGKTKFLLSVQMVKRSWGVIFIVFKWIWFFLLLFFNHFRTYFSLKFMVGLVRIDLAWFLTGKWIILCIEDINKCCIWGVMSWSLMTCGALTGCIFMSMRTVVYLCTAWVGRARLHMATPLTLFEFRCSLILHEFVFDFALFGFRVKIYST